MTKQELAAKIWSTANQLRKNIKASEYKDYILGFMFYKYLSDKEIDFVRQSGGTIDDLRDDSPENMQYFQDNQGYFIQYDDLFSSWKALDQKLGAKAVSTAIENFYRNLNEQYARCFYVYNRTVDTHSGIFDALDSGLSKLGENAGSRDRAVRDIVSLIAQIPPKSQEYDVLGFIYEYLIKQFSSEAKKDGAFYTPNELTTLMARIIADRLKGRDEIKVYDPAVGTAGLLLNIGREAGRYINPARIKYYGQDYITETSNLAKMNLFMQDIPVQNIIVRNADSLADDWPYFDENTSYSPLFVDAVTCNPPYSQHWDPDDHTTDERFLKYGLAPSGKADLAFLLHCLYHIKPDGIMAIILPHGVLFRGDTEKSIRKNLIENHNIETIIGMPANLFFSTGIPVIVMILSKNRVADDVLFIDASQGYTKGKNQNVLRQSDVQRIYDAVTAREDIPNFARLVSKREIVEDNDYNLNIPRYVSAKDAEEPYDLYSVMTGEIADSEIAEYDSFWKQFPALKNKIFLPSGGYNIFNDIDLRETVYGDTDVKDYLASFNHTAGQFQDILIRELVQKDPARADADLLKSVLLQMFGSDQLVDKYDVYQAFSDRWGSVENGISRVRKDGRKVCREVEDDIVSKKNPKTKEYEDKKVGIKGKVISLDLVKQRYFTDDFKKISELESEADSYQAECTELFENLDPEDKTNIVKDDDDSTFDNKKLKAASKSKDFTPEIIFTFRKMLNDTEAEKRCRKEAKQIASELDEKAADKLQFLPDSEIDSLLIEQWIEPITADISQEAENALNRFIADLQELQKKYSDPMDNLNTDMNNSADSVKTMLEDLSGTGRAETAIHMLERDL